MNISEANYLQAREFIYNDVQRELDLARISESPDDKAALVNLGVTPGGGNFLAAVGLLCYTEFAGGLITGKSKGFGQRNFETFFRAMGTAYETLLDGGLDVYDLFRCGMAHEYFAKGHITVAIRGDFATGLGEHSGQLYFLVENYFNDFKKAFDKIGYDAGHLTSEAL